MARIVGDNVDNFLGSDFCGRITNDADILSEDVQKYILATSDFAKGMQTDINHYVTRGRINNASFRQKLDPISKNILQRQNPLELVFEDISTFDAENPMVGSLLRELDLKKEGTDSDLIKNLPSQPGKEFERRKRLDRLKGIKRFPKNNNDDNNNNKKGPLSSVRPVSLPFIDSRPPPGPGSGPDPGFGPSGFNPFRPPPPDPFQPPSPDPFLSRGRYDPPPPPPSFNNNLGNINFGAQPSSFNRSNAGTQLPTNLFGSQTATLMKQKQNIAPKDDVSIQIDDTIYELPEQSNLELGDALIDSLGVKANDLLNSNFITKQEENDAALEQIKQDCNFDEIKDTFDQGNIHESIEFFYGGDNKNFAQNIEFLKPNSDNREFVAFLLSDLGRNIMTSNRLSIHIANGVL